METRVNRNRMQAGERFEIIHAGLRGKMPLKWKAFKFAKANLKPVCTFNYFQTAAHSFKMVLHLSAFSVWQSSDLINGPGMGFEISIISSLESSKFPFYL